MEGISYPRKGLLPTPPKSLLLQPSVIDVFVPAPSEEAVSSPPSGYHSYPRKGLLPTPPGALSMPDLSLPPWYSPQKARPSGPVFSRLGKRRNHKKRDYCKPYPAAGLRRHGPPSPPPCC
ncbi:uncharacterized protein LOC117652347 [Thrips palmi]|uniref:Uncharacterized protein LOC117652347 n=1 Tax=Thrips palmi TaxID=161013 RepID=A0A6P9A5C7_THRPL|nr:uncharacterized protein LOC117652347 [Thrips palmi]